MGGVKWGIASNKLGARFRRLDCSEPSGHDKNNSLKRELIGWHEDSRDHSLQLTLPDGVKFIRILWFIFVLSYRTFSRRIIRRARQRFHHSCAVIRSCNVHCLQQSKVFRWFKIDSLSESSLLRFPIAVPKSKVHTEKIMSFFYDSELDLLKSSTSSNPFLSSTTASLFLQSSDPEVDCLDLDQYSSLVDFQEVSMNLEVGFLT